MPGLQLASNSTFRSRGTNHRERESELATGVLTMGRKGRRGVAIGPVTRSATTNRVIDRNRRGRPTPGSRSSRPNGMTRDGPGPNATASDSTTAPPVGGNRDFEMQTGPGSVEIAPPGPFEEQANNGESVSSCPRARPNYTNGNNNSSQNGAMGNLALVPTTSFPSIIPRQNAQMWGLNPGPGRAVTQPPNPVGNRSETGAINTNRLNEARPSLNQATTGPDCAQGDFTPLMPQCETLGVMVPPNLREKIWKEEFVDLNSLVGERGAQARGTETVSVGGQTGLMLVQEGQQLMLKPPNPKNKIHSIESWTDAFLVYASIYLQAHPTKVQEILKYCSIIRSAASKYTGYGWRDYDVQFRSRKAIANKSWASIDGELWLLHVVGGGSPRLGAGVGGVKPSFGGRAFRRFPTQPQFQSKGPGVTFYSDSSRTAVRRPWTRQPTGRQPGICFELNFGPGKCDRPQCRFLHKCIACGVSGHGKVACPKLRDTTGKQASK